MITFLIPSIGRDTLEGSINSIINQTNDNWKLLIIFDGIKSTINISHPKIDIIEIEQKGRDTNSAGDVRNYGLKYVKTKWVGFVDDDDIIAPDYVESFYNEIKEYPNIDVLIFRMYDEPNNRIIPNINSDNFYVGDVGISFIIKTHIFEKIQFTPSSVEDYEYLNKLRENNYRILISQYIKYYIHGISDINKQFERCNHVLINNETIKESFNNNNNTNYLMICISIVITILLSWLFFYKKRLPNINRFFKLSTKYINRVCDFN